MSAVEETATERVHDLLEAVADALDLDARIDVTDDGETVKGTVEGDDLGLLIGRHGQTIDALEHVAWRVAMHGREERRRVTIDAAGYRALRAETLQRQADQAADEAARYARPVALDAMVPSERRLVHEYLRDRHDVETYSEGDEPHRHLVVAPLAE